MPPLLAFADNPVRRHEFLGAGRGIKLHGERHDLEEEDRGEQERADGDSAPVEVVLSRKRCAASFNRRTVTGMFEGVHVVASPGLKRAARRM